MAQKIYPRSLRSQKQLFPDVSFFSENHYAKVWAVGWNTLNQMLQWSQKNHLYKNMRKKKTQKRSSKKQKLFSFLNTRIYMSNMTGSYSMCPILFKFAYQSFGKKYNPMKALRKNKSRSMGVFPKQHRKTFFKKRFVSQKKEPKVFLSKKCLKKERWLSGL
jgi:hypothetical protein